MRADSFMGEWRGHEGAWMVEVSPRAVAASMTEVHVPRARRDEAIEMSALDLNNEMARSESPPQGCMADWAIREFADGRPSGAFGHLESATRV